MRPLTKIKWLIWVIPFLFACQPQVNDLFQMDNLVAWCVVPFDSTERTPQERITMLDELGFKHFAYDWREKHLATMEEEWNLAKQNGITISSIWIWIDDRSNQPGRLSEANERILQTAKKVGLETQLWVGFNDNFFAGLSEQDAISKGGTMIQYLCKRADSMNCKVALYNHGSWFGEPKNQVKIIQSLQNPDIGIIYNFHHGHDQLAYFPEIIDIALPYLWCVNLNGMEKNGSKILPLGSGDLEKGMIDLLIEKGYTGPFGILGHVENADVKIILENNLEGLHSMFTKS